MFFFSSPAKRLRKAIMATLDGCEIFAECVFDDETTKESTEVFPFEYSEEDVKKALKGGELMIRCNTAGDFTAQVKYPANSAVAAAVEAVDAQGLNVTADATEAGVTLSISATGVTEETVSNTASKALSVIVSILDQMA